MTEDRSLDRRKVEPKGWRDKDGLEFLEGLEGTGRVTSDQGKAGGMMVPGGAEEEGAKAEMRWSDGLGLLTKRSLRPEDQRQLHTTEWS